MCARYGADILGFVTEYPRPVPWNLKAAKAKELISYVPKPTKSCIVTGGMPEKIIKLALEIKPDYVQLHNNEGVRETMDIVEKLRDYNIKIIKALSPDTKELIKTAENFSKTGIYALLFDPRTAYNTHSKGKFDIEIYNTLKNSVNIPVIIAGGINPDNITGLIQDANPPAVDLMTGVEKSFGIKDEERVMSLFKAINS